MNKAPKNFTSSKFFIAALIGIIGLAFVVIADKLYLHRPFFEEGIPTLNKTYLVRSIIIFISVFMLIFGLVGKNRPTIKLFDFNKQPWINLGILGKQTISKLSIFGAYSISVFSFLLALTWAKAFNEVSKEDYHLEWASAILLFGASLIFLFSGLKSAMVLKNSRVLVILLGLYSIIIFVIAMEEVSWFQRVIAFETPEAFANNDQGEFNLHNFFTELAENSYYTGAFFILILLPFISLLYSNMIPNNLLQVAIPKSYIIVVGAAAFSFNFDMWDIVLTQATFFGCIVILWVFYKFLADKTEKRIVGLITIYLIAQQLVFLANPGIIDTVDRDWTLTEYKEFFIPLAFFVFSVDVFLQIKKRGFSKIEARS